MITSYEYQAQYFETDQMGIIHHSNYVRWMESARIWWMHQAGIEYREMEERGIVSPVLEISCRYKSMVHFGDTVLITTEITKYNGVTLELAYRVTDRGSGELRMLGSSKHCFLDSSGKVISLKKLYPEYDRAFASNVKGV